MSCVGLRGSSWHRRQNRSRPSDSMSSPPLTASLYFLFALQDPAVCAVPGGRNGSDSLDIDRQAPEGLRTDQRCLLPCCARVQLQGLEAEAEAAAAEEPNSQWASPGSPAPAAARRATQVRAPGCRAEFPRATRCARKGRRCPPRTPTTSCSWSATCGSSPMLCCS